MTLALQIPDDLSAARILSQGLVDPLPDATQAVRHLGCVQAQDLPGALLSIALRTRSRSLDEVVSAFDDGRLVRSWTMRGTLHVVTAEDLAWILALTGPRRIAAAATRRTQLGIDERLLVAAREVATRRLDGDARATRHEMLVAFDEAGLLEGVAQRGYHLLSTLAMEGLLVQGPVAARTRGGWEQQFVLAASWLPEVVPPEDPVAHWAATYLTGHGPASLADLVRWTGLTRTACRVGIGAHDGLERSTGGGEPFFHASGLGARLAGRRGDADRLLLLPGFDELILGYADRSCTVPPQRATDIVPGNNGMFRATVVDAGRVVGTWRRPAGQPVVEWFEQPSERQLAEARRAMAELPR